MSDFRVPYQAAETEFTEKRSRFIGHLLPVETEEQAREFIAQMKKKYYDARHNCWCYLIGRDVLRYGDDGEPQGTAGIPTLDVLEKSGVTDCVVVVTRYFGGVMLGAGGLVRAYSHSASIALQAAGIVTRTLCDRLQVTCDYNFYGKLASLIPEGGGIVEDTAFEENVTVVFRLPQELTGAFNAKLIDAANGRYSAEKIGELFADID